MINLKLDSNQEAAVHTKAKNAIVVACAGSGKTRVLTERVRHLIVNEGVDPSDIVAITLTNQAADEMSMRLYDVPGIQGAFIGTIHSFAYNILRYLGYKFSILSDEMDYKLHMELIQKYCKYLKKEEYEKYRTYLLAYKLGLADEDNMLKGISHNSLEELTYIEGDKIHPNYPETIKSLCRARGIIQFDDLLRFVVNSGCNIKIKHLLVDEFQDIGTLEYEFITKFDVEHKFFVGDDWQSIYSFRGSNLEIFKALCKDPTFTMYQLTTNYRSCRAIIKFSNRIISYNKGIDKDVTWDRIDNGAIIYKDGDKGLLEILDDIKRVGNFKDYFLLARSNKEVVYLTGLLGNLGIPYAIFKREGMSSSDIKLLMFENSIKVMTIHASKGLECRNVILYGKYGNPGATCTRLKPEEIRVYYVAATRAMNTLYIVESKNFLNGIDPSIALRNISIGNAKPTLSLNSAVVINSDGPKGLTNAMLDNVKKDLDRKHYDQSPEDPFDTPNEKGEYLLPEFGDDNEIHLYDL